MHELWQAELEYKEASSRLVWYIIRCILLSLVLCAHIGDEIEQHGNFGSKRLE